MTEADRLLALLRVTPGWAALGGDDDTAAAVLHEAAKVAQGLVAPLDAVADTQGCRLVEGRVQTPPGFAEAYRQMGRDGWHGIDLPEDLGGQGLPLALHVAASSLFEGACMPFMMAQGASRAAAHMLAEVAPEVAQLWAPRLAEGTWAATICISEPDAGSDVGRIRTRAERRGDGWQVTGSKIWISFGDHDMADRIGHCLLARTGTEVGTRGLSLFLVPDRLEDGRRNGITVTRIEEKMGLHGSPTCALAFEGAEAILLGQEGRGLPQLFAMIERMRLQTACQGLGIAARAGDIARAYAAERRQGGRPDAQPVPIIDHPDVRRQLLAIDAPVAVLRALVLELGIVMDLARFGPEDQRAEEAALAGFLLPLAKNFGAETAFAAASGAMQVLGGAGYTREWPVERLMRDSRVIAIYEGTTGMQAQDFLMRRLLRDDGRALDLFLSRARAEIAACSDPAAAQAQEVIGRFEALSRAFLAGDAGLSGPELAADGYLRAGWHAVCAWLSCRVLKAGDPAPARFMLHALPARMGEAEAACRLPAWV